MRYRPEHKECTHREILTAAAAQFRKYGYSGTGIQKIMRGAGLTVGGFYGHFKSKGALFAETMRMLLDETLAFVRSGNGTGLAWAKAMTERYLSEEHCRNTVGGCCMPILTAEVPRGGEDVQAIFQEKLLEMIQEIETKAPKTKDLNARERAWGLMATWTGGLMLARAVKDKEVADEILAACRHVAVPESQAYQGNGAKLKKSAPV